MENGQILTHGSGGKGYGLASTGVTSGCYQWKVGCIKVYFFSYFVFGNILWSINNSYLCFFSLWQLSWVNDNLWLDSMILRIFSNLDHSMILWFWIQSEEFVAAFEDCHLGISVHGTETVNMCCLFVEVIVLIPNIHSQHKCALYCKSYLLKYVNFEFFL